MAKIMKTQGKKWGFKMKFLISQSKNKTNSKCFSYTVNFNFLKGETINGFMLWQKWYIIMKGICRDFHYLFRINHENVSFTKFIWIFSKYVSHASIQVVKSYCNRDKCILI